MQIKKVFNKNDNPRNLQILQIKEYLITALINDLINIIIEYTINEPYIKGELCNTLKNTNLRAVANSLGPVEIISDGVYVYISDSWTNQIHIMDIKGDSNKSFGRYGTNYSEFNIPRGLCINETHLYVADRQNKRLQIFSVPDVKFIRKIEFKNLFNMVEINKSLLYVSFYMLGSIGEYTLGGELIRNIYYTNALSPGVYLKKFNIYDDDIYMIGDFLRDSVVCMSLNGTCKHVFDGASNGGDLFSNPQCVLVTDISIYIADVSHIQQFDRGNNTFIRAIGKGIINCVTYMAFIDNKLYVFDTYDGYIYVFH